ERAGEPAAARERFARAGHLLEAGRLDEQQGKLREAGLCYEQLLGEAHSATDEGAARLALGRVLGPLGRHEEAVPHLPGGPRGQALGESARREAGHLLVLSLAGLGLRDGARHALRQLTGPPDGGAAPTLEAFLAAAERERGGGDLLVGRYRVLRLIGAGAMGR